MFDEVKSYIQENILYSGAFDEADETIQRKAVNHAEKILYSYYKRFDAETNPLPVEAIAYQTLFMLSKDDSIQRAEQGVTYVSFNGVAMNLSQINRTISPDVIRLLGRKVGRYGLSISETNKGMYSL